MENESRQNSQIIESPQDAVLQEDLEALVRDGSIPFDRLHRHTVFVTGATGLLGSQVIKALACSNRINGTDIRILALVRSREKAERIFGTLLERGDIHIVQGDVTQAVACGEKADYIIHGASATSSKYFVSNPVDTILTAINGTVNMLEFARKNQVKGFLYLSSLEVYGTPSADAGLIGESYSGYLDPLSVRSSYSEGKRMAECLCAAYAAEHKVASALRMRPSTRFRCGLQGFPRPSGQAWNMTMAVCSLNLPDVRLRKKTLCFIQPAGPNAATAIPKTPWLPCF